MANELCTICNREREVHDRDDVHHQFNLVGQLVPKPKKKEPPVNARDHIVAPPGEKVATRLAAVLHDRGLIDSAELVWVLTGGEQTHGSNTAAGNSATADLRTWAEAPTG